MIVVTTGAPGAGKTLLTIDHIRKLAEKDKRPVFYSGIKGLRLPWTEFDKPEDWPTIAKANPGAVIVIDEAQRAFRPRSYGSNVPAHVSELETHRHAGVDIHMITQHPLLLDTNVRRLVGLHRHVVRAFGTQAATVHEWHNGGTKDTCDKSGSREDSIKVPTKYPADVFKLYESAELHTHKRKIPLKVMFLFLAPVLLALIVFGFVRWMNQKIDAKGSAAAPVALSAAQASKPGAKAAVSQAEFLDAFTPRVAGLPHTAPRYDSLTVATVVPIPAVCVATKSRCSCYSQQGTKLGSIDLEVCRGIAANGFFQEFDAGGTPGKPPFMTSGPPQTTPGGIPGTVPVPTKSGERVGPVQGVPGAEIVERIGPGPKAGRILPPVAG